MVKAVLRDDCGIETTNRVVSVVDGDCAYDDPGAPWRFDEAVPDPTGTQPFLALFVRRRAGFDDDGVPLFQWFLAARAPAIKYESREEFDAKAGFTLVRATAMMQIEIVEHEPVVGDFHVVLGNDGIPVRVEAVGGTGATDVDGVPMLPEPYDPGALPIGLHETMVVMSLTQGPRFKVTSYSLTGKRLEMDMVRIDHESTP